MCGIAGILDLENRGIDLAAGARMLSNKLRHRGPDDEGFLLFSADRCLAAWGDDSQEESVQASFNFSPRQALQQADGHYNGVLVHRRLAILDVGAAGHQPMCDASGNVWVTYNGEIYNYVELRKELQSLGHHFRTHSDTEVLINAYLQWGRSCLQRFNGMFAFALLDRKKKLLFCARDRSGVKPFYYYWKNGLFCFASEIKALKALPFAETSLNERAVHHYLAFDALEYEPEGFLKNIFELPHAHCLQIDLRTGELHTQRYYHFAPPKDNVGFTSEGLAKQLSQTKELVTEAIVKRLRADVPVGCCLSGGIDSSVISGVIARYHKNFKAFTAAFPNEAIDESAYAREVAAFTGAQWHVVSPTGEELLRDYENLVYALDIPIWSTSTYAQFRVMRLAHEQGIKVVLDGQGGDELFGGYPHYYTTYVNQLFRSGRVRAALGELKHLGARAYSLERLKRRLNYQSSHRWLNEEFVAAHAAPAQLRARFGELNEHLAYDFFGGRLKTYLRCEDRCSMHFSVESRTPFADDTPLLEEALSIPAVYKIRGGVSKYILRESMQGFMPEQVYARRDKMGFVTPHNKWLGALLAAYPGLEQNPIVTRYFNNKFQQRLRHLTVNSDHLPNHPFQREESLVFKALTLSVWYRQFGA
jgi:asparagine synthase (glutamine-hydrolysing)